MHETFGDLGIIHDKTSKKVRLSLQAMNFIDGMRRRQIYNGLNFQRIHLNTFVRNNEPEQSTWLDAENALVEIQVSFLVFASFKY